MFSTSFVFSFCLSVLAIPSGSNSASEYVDLIELNHFYDHKGQHVYDQVIFYERSAETGRFQVRAWCLVEDRHPLNRRPVKNANTDLYQVDWADNDQGMTRHITSRLYRESWTQLDPERANKKILDERSRISLIQNPRKFQAMQRQEEAKVQAANAALASKEAETVPSSTTIASPDALVSR